MTLLLFLVTQSLLKPSGVPGIYPPAETELWVALNAHIFLLDFRPVLYPTPPNQDTEKTAEGRSMYVHESSPSGHQAEAAGITPGDDGHGQGKPQQLPSGGTTDKAPHGPSSRTTTWEPV